MNSRDDSRSPRAIPQPPLSRAAYLRFSRSFDFRTPVESPTFSLARSLTSTRIFGAILLLLHLLLLFLPRYSCIPHFGLPTFVVSIYRWRSLACFPHVRLSTSRSTSRLSPRHKNAHSVGRILFPIAAGETDGKRSPLRSIVQSARTRTHPTVS